MDWGSHSPPSTWLYPPPWVSRVSEDERESAERRWDEVRELKDQLLAYADAEERMVELWDGEPVYDDPKRRDIPINLRMILKDGRTYQLEEGVHGPVFESSIQQIEEVGSHA